MRCRLPVADVSRMAFTPDGNTLAVLRTTVHLTGEILVECWDLPAAVKVSRYRDEERYAEEAVLEFSPDGKYLCYGRSSLRRLDWARGVLAFHVPVSAGTSKAEIITAFAESADGTTLITAEGHNSIHFRDPASGNERCKIDGVADVGRLTLSTDGKLLALGNTKGVCRTLAGSDGRGAASGRQNRQTDAASAREWHHRPGLEPGQPAAGAAGERCCFPLGRQWR